MSLFAYAKYNSSYNNAAKKLHAVSQTWNETAVTWNNKPTYSSTVLANNTNTAVNVWEDYDVTSTIKSIVETNAANNGFVLIRNYSGYSGVNIYSSEYATAANRPKLTIVYDTVANDTQAPAIKVNTPNGGETLKAGASYNITWTATDNVGVVSRAIYYTSTNTGTAWTKIDSAATNTGTFAWTVPNVSSKTCKVRILAYDAARNVASDMSDTLFFIDAQAPKVSVTAPAVGETIKQGSVYAIKWTATDDISVTSRAIYYSTNNGTTWTKVDSAATNTGTFNWTVPNVTSANCLIRIDAYDPVRNKGTAQSGQFKIEPQSGILPNTIVFSKGVSYKLTVTNIQGKEVLSCNINSINQLNHIKNLLPSGINIIRISAADKSFCKKLWFAK